MSDILLSLLIGIQVASVLVAAFLIFRPGTPERVKRWAHQMAAAMTLLVGVAFCVTGDRLFGVLIIAAAALAEIARRLVARWARGRNAEESKQ
ncbi:hypothetical protein ACFWGI_36625 [Streptomyces niveus]|uniref:hypothetical protein n=1 Tax=Streptomyces niveus TaxID=193462 RepID=UPI003651906D